MMAALIIAVLLIVLGLLWARRIADRNNDGDMGAALLAVGIISFGAVILLVTLLVFVAKHVHLGWA